MLALIAVYLLAAMTLTPCEQRTIDFCTAPMPMQEWTKKDEQLCLMKEAENCQRCVVIAAFNTRLLKDIDPATIKTIKQDCEPYLKGAQHQFTMDLIKNGK